MNKLHKSYKKFIASFLFAILIFAAANYFIWKQFTETLLTNKFAGGELARLTLLPDFRDARKRECDLPVKHLEMKDYNGQRIDVMTIGDSFSFGIGGGRNGYYQDYIASINNVMVLNVYPYDTGDLIADFQPLSTLIVLYNSGCLDIIKPKYILIESIERYCIMRYGKPLNFNYSDNLDNIIAFYKDKKFDPDRLHKVYFINNGNLQFLINNLMYKLDHYPINNLVRISKLDRDMFTVTSKDKLLFCYEDLGFIPLSNKNTLKLLNDNFNIMADLLAKRE